MKTNRLLHYLRNWSLMVKIPALVVGVAILLAGTLLWPIVYQMASMEVENAEKRIQAFLASGGEGIVPYLHRKDYWAAFDLLKRLQESQSDMSVEYVVVTDKNSKVFVGTDPRQFPILSTWPASLRFDDLAESRGLLYLMSTPRMGVSLPIQKEGLVLGHIHSMIDLSEIKERIWGVSLFAIIFTLLATFICGAIGYAISREMMRPLSKLTNQVDQIGKGDIGHVDLRHFYANDEIYQLIKQFNHMATALLEKEKIAKQIAVESKLMALGKLTASMAHEINNPLGGMLNVVNTLERHGDDSSVREKSLPLLERGIKQIQSIVQAALVTYRFDNDHAPLQPLDLEDIRLLIQSEMKSSNIVLEWKNGIKKEVKLPAVPIRQLVLNLLLNSSEAMVDGGRLLFEAGENQKSVSFVVEDTGPGMSEDLVEGLSKGQLFMDKEPEGLGLWICSQLIHQLNGEWDVLSKRGVGTRIEVNFPINQESFYES